MDLDHTHTTRAGDRRVSVIGDIHGQYERLVALLRDAELVGADLSWRGGNAVLWFIGDFFDRGPDGIAVIELIMTLQQQAAGAGGQVAALLGNHEPLLLAAQRFGHLASPAGGETFMTAWERNGGRQDNLDRLTPAHVAWLSSRPVIARGSDRLFVHADAAFYLRYGRSIAEVNAVVAAVLHGDDTAAWNRLLNDFSERLAFADGDAGTARARIVLHLFGGRQIVHGHTPICYLTHQSPAEITGPLIYAEGHCVNVDGGLYLGGRGFIYQLPPLGR